MTKIQDSFEQGYSAGYKRALQAVKEAVLKADVGQISSFGSAGAGIMYKSMLDYLESELKKVIKR